MGISWSVDIGALLIGCTVILLTILSMWQAGRKSADERQRELTQAIECLKKESSDGRARLYDRFESFGHEIRATFLPRDLYQADMRTVQHAQEEHALQIQDLSRRIDAKCEIVRSRREPATERA